MDLYKRTFLVSAIIISLPCVFFAITCLQSPLGLVALGVGFTWWLAYQLLRNDLKFAFTFSFILANVFWWPLLFDFARRLFFMIRIIWLENVDGDGAPLKLLLGTLLEQFFFIPSTLVVARGVLTLIRREQPTFQQTGRKAH